MNTQKTYTLNEIQDLLAYLDNGIGGPQDKMGRYRRVQLPIPKEYGGGIATGYGYEEAVRNLIERIKDKIIAPKRGPMFEECWEAWLRLCIRSSLIRSGSMHPPQGSNMKKAS